LITIEFPNDAEKYNGYAEIAIGSGLLLGPVIGSIFYGYLGYIYTF
jgi:hypothetical protein